MRGYSQIFIESGAGLEKDPKEELLAVAAAAELDQREIVAYHPRHFLGVIVEGWRSPSG